MLKEPLRQVLGFMAVGAALPDVNVDGIPILPAELFQGRSRLHPIVLGGRQHLRPVRHRELTVRVHAGTGRIGCRGMAFGMVHADAPFSIRSALFGNLKPNLTE